MIHRVALADYVWSKFSGYLLSVRIWIRRSKRQVCVTWMKISGSQFLFFCFFLFLLFDLREIRHIYYTRPTQLDVECVWMDVIISFVALSWLFVDYMAHIYIFEPSKKCVYASYLTKYASSLSTKGFSSINRCDWSLSNEVFKRLVGLKMEI